MYWNQILKANSIVKNTMQILSMTQNGKPKTRMSRMLFIDDFVFDAYVLPLFALSHGGMISDSFSEFWNCGSVSTQKDTVAIKMKKIEAEARIRPHFVVGFLITALILEIKRCASNLESLPDYTSQACIFRSCLFFFKFKITRSCSFPRE